MSSKAKFYYNLSFVINNWLFVIQVIDTGRFIFEHVSYGWLSGTHPRRNDGSSADIFSSTALILLCSRSAYRHANLGFRGKSTLLTVVLLVLKQFNRWSLWFDHAKCYQLTGSSWLTKRNVFIPFFLRGKHNQLFSHISLVSLDWQFKIGVASSSSSCSLSPGHRWKTTW